MTVRFWRWATVVSSVACLASVVVWWCAIGWNPPIETLRERAWYGYVVSALTVLSWFVHGRYSAAALRGR